MAVLHEPSSYRGCIRHGSILLEPQSPCRHCARETRENGLVRLLKEPVTFSRFNSLEFTHRTGNAIFLPSITYVAFLRALPFRTIHTNLIIVNSLLIMGLVWGGQPYPWDSAHVLAPMIIGAFGLVVWYFVERHCVAHPTVPFKLLTNRTTLVGYFTTLIHGIPALCGFYYW